MARHGNANSRAQKSAYYYRDSGRLVDHMQRTVSLNHINFVILDEADRMLDIDSRHKLKILSHCQKNVRRFCFLQQCQETAIASQHMKMPLRIEVAPQGTPAAY